MEQDEKTIGDFVEILKRRKLSLVLPAVAVFIVALIVALTWPPVYRSTSTILIEDQEIPREFVIASVTGYAEQRLQTINQRIMSTSKLLEIINRFNPYPEMKSKYAVEEIVETMRKDIKLETISADVLDRRTGGARTAAIAFTLSYDGKRPQEVQQIANVLTSLYLEENLKVRERQASGTSKFLEDEAKLVLDKLTQIESKIAAFRRSNMETMPELLQSNMQSLDRTERDIDQLRSQLLSLKEREGYLQAQLASMPPTGSASQYYIVLKDLKAKLVQLQTKYTDKNYEVIRTKEEIKELEERIKSEQADQQSGQQKYKVSPSDTGMGVMLVTQLAQVQGDIESTQKQIEASKKKQDDYVRRIEATPRADETFKALMIERNNTQLKYDDLTKKVMEARVAQGLEKEQMGERFTLIDPARLPEKPVKPNRPAIVLIGLVLAMGAGVGSAALRETLDTSVRSASQVAAITPVPVLAVVPEIVTWKDRLRMKTRRRKIAVGVGVALVLGIVIFQLFVMDLDVFWARALRKLRI
ncbi:MAG: Wzz/FepE/Etk N-terminal domain-containing protein [Syntrophorhabdales bacterium]